MTKIIKLIYSNDGRAGLGTEDDPIRSILRLYTPDGILVAECDPENWDGRVVNLDNLHREQ